MAPRPGIDQLSAPVALLRSEGPKASLPAGLHIGLWAVHGSAWTDLAGGDGRWRRLTAGRAAGLAVPPCVVKHLGEGGQAESC